MEETKAVGTTEDTEGAEESEPEMRGKRGGGREFFGGGEREEKEAARVAGA